MDDLAEILCENELFLLSELVKTVGEKEAKELLELDIRSALSIPEGIRELRLISDNKKELILSKLKKELVEIKQPVVEQRRASDTMSEGTVSNKFIYFLAAFWSIFTCAYVFSITFVEIDENNVRFADTILGFLLGTVVAQIISKFFGVQSVRGNSAPPANINNRRR